MDKLIIDGPNILKGEVEVSSSKNASLPIIAACLLVPGKVSFDRLPGLSDVSFFLKILESLGAVCEIEGDRTIVDCSNISNTTADYELVRKMRASVLVLGPLLARFGKATVSLPGGCSIGTRPVDIHLSAFEAMGAKITLEGGYIHAHSNGPLKGCEINFSFPSVGATENLMMAAAYAEGRTILNNAAREPEIVDLANFLRALGVKISGDGTSTVVINPIKVENCENVGDLNYRVIGDRIEAATFVIAALMCEGSEVKVSGFSPEHISAVTNVLGQMGAQLDIKQDSIIVKSDRRLKCATIDTEPYPGFPTDVQAQMMTLMGISEGISVVSEHIFENRFMHVPELTRMGMKISLDGHVAKVEGVKTLSSAPVMCTDLRASAALVLASLVAPGKSSVSRIYHLDRGYQELEKKLQKLGAKIERTK